MKIRHRALFKNKILHLKQRGRGKEFFIVLATFIGIIGVTALLNITVLNKNQIAQALAYPIGHTRSSYTAATGNYGDLSVTYGMSNFINTTPNSGIVSATLWDADNSTFGYGNTPGSTVAAPWYTPGMPLRSPRLAITLGHEDTSQPSSQTLTVNFSRPVTNPRFNLYNLDGSRLDFSGTDQSNGSPLATINSLSGNSLFAVNGLTVNDPTRLPTTGGCDATTYVSNGACGTIELVGTFTQVVIGNYAPTSSGDGWHFNISFPAADMEAVSKVLSDPSPAPGETITYTTTFRNNGSDAVTSTTIDDSTLPALLQNVSWTCAGGGGASCGASTSGSGAPSDLPVGPIPVNGTLTLVVTGTINPSTVPGASLNNTASVDISGDPLDVETSNNTTNVTGSVGARESDLSITKQATDPTTGDPVTSVVPGTNLDWKLEATNIGPSDAQTVTVTDTLPAGVTPVVASGSGWSCAIVGQTVTCTRSTFAAGANSTITIQSQVSPGVSGTLENDAEISSPIADPTPGNNADQISVTTDPRADLAITKAHAGTPVAGNTMNYTLTVTNMGPSNSPSFTVSDTLDLSLSYVSVSSPDGVTCGAVGQVVTCTGQAIGRGSTHSFTLTVAVDAGYPGGTIANAATVAPPVGVTDPVPTNNTATDNTAIEVSADLAVVKSHTGTFVAGQDATYEVVVTNNGPSAAAGNSITAFDPLPVGISFVSATGPGWTCNEIGGSISCVLSGTLGASASSTITIVVHIGEAVHGMVTNESQVTSSSPDPDLDNNTANDSANIVAISDLAATKTLTTTDPMLAGGQATYEIEVTNNGSSTALNAVISDPLPSSLSYVSGDGDGWSCSVNGSEVVTCNRASIGVGETTSVALIVDVAPDAPATIVNTASVTSDSDDPTPNDPSTTNNVEYIADVAIEKTHGSGTFNPGGTVTYNLAVTNNGVSNAQGVELIDVLPAGLSYVGSDGDGVFSCGNSGQIVTCNAAQLAVGGGAINVTITAKIADGFVGALTNTADITTTSTDPELTNNTSSDMVDVSSESASPTPEDGSPLPSTGQNLILLLLVGGGLIVGGAVLLLRFHYVKSRRS